MDAETLNPFSLNISYWVLQTLAMTATALLLPRLKVTSIFGPLMTVISLSFINSKIWDTALFFKVPESFTSHAVLLLISNGLIFWILVKLLPGIEIHGFLPAILAPVIFTVCSFLISEHAQHVDWKNVFTEIFDFLSHVKSYFKETPVEKKTLLTLVKLAIV